MSVNTSAGNGYIMYGSPVSLFTGKLRSYMRKKGIPYRERLTSHPDFAAKIFPVVGRMVIPVIETPNGDILQDTCEIMDTLELRHEGASIYPTTPRQRLVSHIIELFGTEGLIKPAMHYRWNFDAENDHFISLEFGRFMNPQAEDAEAKDLAKLPKSMMSGLVKVLGVTEETIPTVEAGYEALLAALDAHFLKYPYLFGGRPTVADFSLYAPLYAHLARDPAPAMLMKQKANRVWRWVERMTVADCDMPEFPDMAEELLADDEIPETLIKVLKVIAEDYLPEYEGLVGFMNGYLAENSVEEGASLLPDPSKRSLGFFNCTLRGQEFSLVARNYSLWLAQRIHAAYDNLSGVDKNAANELLAETGLAALCNKRCNQLISRKQFKEVWDTARP
ncbi:MAG: glutathione S-transferase [Kordiimonadales bacterium]|nr:MAG: glutathione S-transferase [Kordiimonadales bacterium]